MSSIGFQYLSALNSSAPALILIAFGYIISALKIYPYKQYGHLTSLAFKIALPVKTIFTLSSQPLTHDDGILILGIVVSSVFGFLLTLPICFVYPREDRFSMFAALSAVIL